ncbi:SHOCT domain-containing protein [Candidatus Pacearchaeota archaeon]|nr:SHOCT domain-containing protein [Candidatus Pacearchaeota archaeon]
MPIGITGCAVRDGFKPVMGFHPYGWVFQLLILFAVGFVIYWVVRGNKNESAIDIVKKRFAAGEISEKEFLKIKKVLR